MRTLGSILEKRGFHRGRKLAELELDTRKFHRKRRKILVVFRRMTMKKSLISGNMRTIDRQKKQETLEDLKADGWMDGYKERARDEQEDWS